jgi:hypothetical protein
MFIRAFIGNVDCQANDERSFDACWSGMACDLDASFSIQDNDLTVVSLCER